MEAEIDGAKVVDEAAFHREIASALRFPSYYGSNLNALWDTMTTDVERPVRLVWKNSKVSQQKMGSDFASIIELLRKVEKQDLLWKLEKRFELILR